jgi:hypothetical protein
MQFRHNGIINPNSDVDLWWAFEEEVIKILNGIYSILTFPFS